MRAEQHPDTRSHTLLRDGIKEESHLTYAELDSRARAVAAYLQQTTEPGARALLMYGPGLEFIVAFFGCLYAGVIGVPSSPPRGQQGTARFDGIVRDCDPEVILTTADHLAKIPSGGRAAVCATDMLAAGKGWTEFGRIADDTLAYLQYTSGSTSEPKGVMVRHGNLMANLLDMDRGWEHDEASSLVSWLPHFHDMGLVYGILQPIYSAIPGYLMSPLSFLQRPVRWLQCISHYRATHSVAPNFAYELCIRKIDPAEREKLDLSCWAVAVNGAEPVRQETIDRFSEFLAPSGFRRSAFCPGYGLAEATLKVTATARRQEPQILDMEDGRHLVGCGRTMTDTIVEIVNPETRTRCAADEVGEIWVSGATVAGGYWNNADATAASFGAIMEPERQGPFLRTGDLGFVRGDHLYVTGRLKDLIIIRGQNHYPQDIEKTSEESHPFARRPGYCAAFSVDAGNEERLVIVQEIEKQFRDAALDEVVEDIRQAVAEKHDLQAHGVVLVQAGSLPKTSSGKIQRQACRNAYLKGSLDLCRSQTEPGP